MLGHLGAVLSHVGVMLLLSWCQEGLSSKNIENNEILAPPDLTNRWRGERAAGTVFLKNSFQNASKTIGFFIFSGFGGVWAAIEYYSTTYYSTLRELS